MTDTSIIFSRSVNKKLRGRIHKETVIWTIHKNYYTHSIERQNMNFH
jgi:hypothetical protein